MDDSPGCNIQHTEIKVRFDGSGIGIREYIGKRGGVQNEPNSSYGDDIMASHSSSISDGDHGQ